MGKRTKSFVIRHDQRLCKRCGICVAFCPGECLAQNETGRVIVVAEERCIGCRLCAIRCPDMAIEVMETDKVEN